MQDLRRVSNQNHEQYGDCIVHLIVQNESITKLSLGSSQSQPEVQRFNSIRMWLFSVVWYWTGMRVASTTSHHTTTTRNPTRDSSYSRRLILGVLTSLKTSELVDAGGFLSKHLLSRGHLSPNDGEDPLLQSPWLRSVDKALAVDTLEWLSQNKETFTAFKSFEGNDW